MNNPTFFFHLQFADDTLLLGVKSWMNVRALMIVLVLFEIMSGIVSSNLYNLKNMIIKNKKYGYFAMFW